MTAAATLAVALSVPQLLVAGTPCEPPAGVDRTFGEELRLAPAQTVPVRTVLAKPDDYDGEVIRLGGTVRQVCARRGCWLALGDDGSDDTVFVKFTCPIEGRLIPAAAVGRKAVVEGTFEVREIAEDIARHVAEEAGKSEAEVAAIRGPQKQLHMKSPAALVRGLPPE